MTPEEKIKDLQAIIDNEVVKGEMLERRRNRLLWCLLGLVALLVLPWDLIINWVAYWIRTKL